MKRLMILAASAAIAGVAFAGSASAETSQMPSAEELLTCLQLERDQPGVCADTKARTTVAAVLDGKTVGSSASFDVTGGLVPQSLTQ